MMKQGNLGTTTRRLDVQHQEKTPVFGSVGPWRFTVRSIVWPAAAPVTLSCRVAELPLAIESGEFVGMTTTPDVVENTWIDVDGVGPLLVIVSSRYLVPSGRHLKTPCTFAHSRHSGRRKQTCWLGQHHRPGPSGPWSRTSTQTTLPGWGFVMVNVPEMVPCPFGG